MQVRFVAANLHPEHDTTAIFRRTNKAACEAAFLQVLLREPPTKDTDASVPHEAIGFTAEQLMKSARPAPMRLCT